MRRGLFWVAGLGLVLAAVCGATEMLLVPWTVEGASMAPTLLPGDRVLVDRWTFGVRPPYPGEIVLVRDPRGRSVVKRVVSVEGDEVRVLGDHKEDSLDSRQWGPLDRSALRGRVVWRYAPAARQGRLRN